LEWAASGFNLLIMNGSVGVVTRVLVVGLVAVMPPGLARAEKSAEMDSSK
jgi:hypothetical protein